MTKRLICAVLAVVLLTSIPQPVAAADTYHYGVGGVALFPCTYRYMPMQTSNGLMVPVNLLIESGLGLSGNFSEREASYTIYYTARPRQFLTFFTNRSGSFDVRWSYSDQSILRQNGVFYVPLHFVAERLNFNASTFSTPYGTVTRVSLATDTMTNSEVERTLSGRLSRAQESYRIMNGLAQPPPKVPPNVYLGFNADMNSDISIILDLLDEKNITATFFITPEFAEHGDVRSIIVRGHTLGIQLDGSEDLNSLTYANEHLRLSALTQTRILLIPEDPRLRYDILETVGYRLWKWELDGQSPNIFRTIDNAQNASYVRFRCDSESVETLTALLEQLKTLDAEYYAINEAQPPVLS
jgi:peptidoglycan/xylan/chitin deacetylase (PgdA/CDA1 family)